MKLDQPLLKMCVCKLLTGLSFVLLALCVEVFEAERSTVAVDLSAPVGLCTTATYLKYVRALKCNQTYGQQLVNLYLGCGYNDMALMETSDCGMIDGEFCFDIADRALTYQAAVDSLCFDAYGKPNCGNSCREALWSFRENVGCCVNNLYNASDEPVSNDRTASNVLWTACDVTPIDGFCRSTLHYEEVHDAVVCVYDEVVYRKNLLGCSPDYGQAFADLFRKCGYTSHLRHAVNNCGVNVEDRYCFELISEGSALAAAVQEQCVETVDSECPLACQVALDDYRRQLGCCLNNLYNDEDNSFFSTTSPALWKTCKVKRPKFCKTTISMTGGGSSVTTSAVVFLHVLAVSIITVY